MIKGVTGCFGDLLWVDPRASKSFGEEFGNQSALLEGVNLLQESERGTLA
jgi:hypothetical protein